MPRLVTIGRAVALIAYLAFGWIMGLVLVPVLIVRAIMLGLRIARALAPAVRCPDGHAVPNYGRYVCSVCRFEAFSWAWRCGWCGATYGHCPCPTCQQSCGNPLLR